MLDKERFQVDGLINCHCWAKDNSQSAQIPRRALHSEIVLFDNVFATRSTLYIGMQETLAGCPVCSMN